MIHELPSHPLKPETLEDERCYLRSVIEHAIHYLPTQGPITIFIHHNTLHAFEHLKFDQAVVEGGRVFGCEPYLSEDRYRDELHRGRIRPADLEAMLHLDLGEDADRLVACFGTRFALRLAMLKLIRLPATGTELHWIISESDALDRFGGRWDRAHGSQIVKATRQWYLRLGLGNGHPKERIAGIDSVVELCGGGNPEAWSEARWEKLTLRLLWKACCQGVAGVPKTATDITTVRGSLRGRCKSSDPLVHELLIRFCAAFLDQGLAPWRLPHREEGFARAFAKLHTVGFSPLAPWMDGVPQSMQEVLKDSFDPLDSIIRSLNELGIAREDWPDFIRERLLALQGWTGMIWQLETNAPWTQHPAPQGTLLEFLAVRLILDRLADKHLHRSPSTTSNAQPKPTSGEPDQESMLRAYTVFQLALHRGWGPEQLLHLSRPQWTRLIEEIDAFHSLERRRIFHAAYERKFRNAALDAIAVHSQTRRLAPSFTIEQPPLFQIICCIDEREESFRRALEELEPQCETLGVAGFFGVAMLYRGVADALYKPLCPVMITPQHYVQEEPSYSLLGLSRRQAEGRRRLGNATHRVHVGTRTLFGGLLAGVLGSLAAIPMVARILFPRTTSRIRQLFGSITRPAITQLRLERTDAEPSPSERGWGYSVEEMADVVEGQLRAIGLTKVFAKIVVICGHGSSSLNNPHEAAYDCGACGGGRGGPNARAYSQMANDTRVRRILSQRGLEIPDEVTFIGCLHNTGNDEMEWYDLDSIPIARRGLFERIRDTIDVARQENARERVRRFENADLSISTDSALRHVEGRASDLSQARPECGHATNALCFVGRRNWSRNLFLDRRAFLVSYDPSQDDSKGSILLRLLSAVVPVCSGINLEYYFSYVDPTGYGCGTKLPHNIASLLGVMNGALSDLRPGLPWQMVEIHEPVRLLFVIETTAEVILGILEQNPTIRQIVAGNWVQFAVLDAATSKIELYRNGAFEPYVPDSCELPTANASHAWYRGSRDCLPFAVIARDGPGDPSYGQSSGETQ
jgi:hypothetical protein